MYWRHWHLWEQTNKVPDKYNQTWPWSEVIFKLIYHIQSTILYIFRLTCLFKLLIIIPGTSLVFQTVCVSTLLRYSHHQIFIFIGKLLLLCCITAVLLGISVYLKSDTYFIPYVFFGSYMYIYNALLHLLPPYLRLHCR